MRKGTLTPCVLYESGHEKMCLMSYANNKGADQPARPQAYSIISLDSIAEISRV